MILRRERAEISPLFIALDLFAVTSNHFTTKAVHKSVLIDSAITHAVCRKMVTTP